ncbi:hypothetical protein C0584_03115 [Candidatus Parcubacteria bacterium]|nr:MAG: hypothetical protein C0584_03115 [Candidatus Parcubacteria bacterium]
MKKYLIITFLIIIYFGINNVSAFNNTVVHPGISSEAINLYLRSGNDGKISSTEIRSILKGAENEDTDPRYLNHFYNPENNQSLLEVFGQAVPTAKEWAFTQKSETGDYSVPTILENYREGNTKRAFEGIGHILHLIQDMGTPAHVRIDPHPPTDPDRFEQLTESNAKYSYIDTGFNNMEVESIFDNFANYTLNNFYSDDTIDNSIKIEEFITKTESDSNLYVYGLKNGHVVCSVLSGRKNNICIFNDYVYRYYWQALYPLSVQYSASAIDWFMREFDRIDQEKEELSFWSKSWAKIASAPSRLIKNTKYVWGDTYLATRDGLGYFISGTGEAGYYTGLALEQGTDKVIKSSIEIVRAGTMGTLSSIGEASFLAGSIMDSGIKKSLDISQELGAEIKEGVETVEEVIEEIPKVVQAEEEKIEEEIDEPKVLGESNIEEAEEKTDTSKTDIYWKPRRTSILFSGGSPIVEEDPPQDLTQISFRIFNPLTGSEIFTSTSTIGVEINQGELENLEYLISEDKIVQDPNWTKISPSEYILSEENAEKKIYLHIRDENSDIVLEKSIILNSVNPIIEFALKPAYYSSSTEASFIFSSNIIPSIFEYSFNEEEYQVSTLDKSISVERVFDEGQNILNIRIEDDFGRVATNSYEWIVDIGEPAFSFTEATSTDDIVSLSWENVGTEEISPLENIILETYLDSELIFEEYFSPEMFRATTTYQDLLSFRLRGKDLAGNVGDWAVIALAQKKKPIIPEAISDFSANSEELGVYEVGLIWSSKENYRIDDRAYYDMRYQAYTDTCTIIDTWDEGSRVASSSMPEVSSSTSYQEIVVEGLNPDTEYCFAIRVFNGETFSNLSNVVYLKTRTLPAKEATIVPIRNDYILIDRLTKDKSPYLIKTKAKVPPGGIVIEPGVVIKFTDFYGNLYAYQTTLLAYGPIIAIGTEEEPIVFTSDKDDEEMGDTNQDGNITSPVAGSWGNIELYTKGSVLNNVHIKYAGRNVKRGFLSIYEDENIITNSIFENITNGIEVFHASSTKPSQITNNTFINCGGSISPQDGSNPIIENNVFK